ncbi:MAG: hypothetical protein ACR2P0_15225 [Acidimicrobiales bacterium]
MDQHRIRPRGAVNRFFGSLLRSPLHRLISGRMCLVHYRGRRTGRAFVTPVQYVEDETGLVVLVGWPTRKTWWRNFLPRAGNDADLLIRGRWRPMRGWAIDEPSDPALAGTLMSDYLEKFPRAASSFRAEGSTDTIAARLLVFRTRPGT